MPEAIEMKNEWSSKQPLADGEEPTVGHLYSALQGRAGMRATLFSRLQSAHTVARVEHI